MKKDISEEQFEIAKMLAKQEASWKQADRTGLHDTIEKEIFARQHIRRACFVFMDMRKF